MFKLDSVTTQPLVTVITPVYNQGKFLEETILSVLGQGYANLQYIVLDDGSTDHTPQVLARYQDQLTLCHHQNMGESFTVNRGFHLAKGELICVLSADDPMLPGAIQAGVDALAAAPDAAVAYPDWIVIDEAGLIRAQVRTRDYSLRDMVQWHLCLPGPSSLFRRYLLDHLGGRDASFRYVGDFDFWLRAGLVAPFVRVPGFYGCFREHQASTSTSGCGPAMADEHITLMDKFFSMTLPADLQAMHREALFSANYVAGCVAGRGFSDRARYFLRSVEIASWELLKCQRWRMASMLLLLFESLPPVAWLQAKVRARRRLTAWQGKHYGTVIRRIS